jgi:hypothetical protein
MARGSRWGSGQPPTEDLAVWRPLFSRHGRPSVPATHRWAAEWLAMAAPECGQDERNDWGAEVRGGLALRVLDHDGALAQTIGPL